MPPVDKTPAWDNDDGDDFEIPEDEWQPRGANAHLEGISRVVKKRADGVPGAAAPGGNRGASRRAGSGGRPMRTRPGQASRAFTGPMDTPRVDNDLPATPNRNGGRGNNVRNNAGGRGNGGGNRAPNGAPKQFGAGNTPAVRTGGNTGDGRTGNGGGGGGNNGGGNGGNKRRTNNIDNGNRSADANGNRAPVAPRPQGGERPPQQRNRRRNNQRRRPDGVAGTEPAGE